MADGESSSIKPCVDYGEDKKDPDNYVCVRVDIPKLKKRCFFNKASNADVKLSYTDRSFSLHVNMTNSGNANRYVYDVKKLPGDIDGKRSYHKIKKEEVVIKLRKAESGSWSRQLSADGLETAEDTEEPLELEGDK